MGTAFCAFSKIIFATVGGYEGKMGNYGILTLEAHYLEDSEISL
jgi:hypothetical protein